MQEELVEIMHACPPISLPHWERPIEGACGLQDTLDSGEGSDMSQPCMYQLYRIDKN
jgi:hypothetical protein